MILLLFVSFHWILLVAVNEVTQFGFLTHTNPTSGSIDNFIVTLWFNHTIYQNQFDPTESNTWYHAYKDTPNPTFTILGSSHCNPESKIMFEQMNGDDSVKVDTIQFSTETGDFYAIRSDGVIEEFMCVDAVGTTCEPPKQIFYFDISRPNAYIEDAVHMDATSVTPQIETCDPTASPSNDPTKSPSNHPSVNPSRATAIPSITPTESPTRDPFKYERTAAEDNVQFTIEIKLNSCTNDESQPCVFDVTEDEINTILIAYLDETVTIVGTVIERDTISVVLSHGHEQLDRDRITDGIENDLEREYGQDVEVTVTITNDEQDEHESTPFTDFIASYGMTHIVAVAIAISICLIISLALCCYFMIKRKTPKLREEHMIARQGTDHGASPGGNVVRCKDNDDTESPDKDAVCEDDGRGEGSQMLEESVVGVLGEEDECISRNLGSLFSITEFDSEFLYDNASVGVTKSETTKGSTTKGATTKGLTCRQYC